jgi:hypothetical protein
VTIARLRRLDLPTLRAAWWSLRAVRRVRRNLLEGGLDAITLPSVPLLPASAERGVRGVLRRSRSTCLVQATVLQAWLAAHGDERDLIIGVQAPRGGFRAHAWLDGDAPCHPEGFHELVRRPVR